jgi:hypothetical protein
MLKSNPNFTIGLNVMITTLLSSTRPKHPNIKILDVSLLFRSIDLRQIMLHKSFLKSKHSGLVTLFTRILIHVQQSSKWYLILWWKVRYVFTCFEDTRHFWLASWLGDSIKYVFYVALAFTCLVKNLYYDTFEWLTWQNMYFMLHWPLLIF